MNEVALDWFNGRRSPDANHTLKGALFNLTLATDAPRIFQILVEATAFGSKRVVEAFTSQGIRIDGIIAVGGISHKSPFIMQTLADVLNLEIRVQKSIETCAIGSCMFAATLNGNFSSIEEAMSKMGSGFIKIYKPNCERQAVYQGRYERYLKMGNVIEKGSLSTA